MRALLIVLVAGACAAPVGLGEASSSAHESAASATTTVANVVLLEPPGEYRVWRIEIGEDAPGTDCNNRGTPLITFDVFTIFNSAPRGRIVLSNDPPPRVFPAAFGAVIDGVALTGELAITEAASTGLAGTFLGQVTIAGAAVRLDVAFEAPTCGA